MERQICTKENPWNKEQQGRWQHPDAIEIDEDYGKGGGVAVGVAGAGCCGITGGTLFSP